MIAREQAAVYGLRNAPRAWWKRIVRDLTETGWVQHQLDQCTFMFMNGTELVGLIGVYVGDFLVAGCNDDPVFSAALSKLKSAFKWRTWNEDNGIEIETLQDGGFQLRQQKFVDQLGLISLSQRRSRAHTDKLTPGNSASRSVWFCELVGKPDSSGSLCEYASSPRCTSISNG